MKNDDDTKKLKKRTNYKDKINEPGFGHRGHQTRNQNLPRYLR